MPATYDSLLLPRSTHTMSTRSGGQAELHPRMHRARDRDQDEGEGGGEGGGEDAGKGEGEGEALRTPLDAVTAWDDGFLIG